MIRNLWSDEAARAAGEGDLAQRVYSSRLIGADPDLVLHGGGNTSVKTTALDLFGEPVEVLHIKGSGHDLATIGADGLPAVRLAPMLDLKARDAVADDALVKLQRLNLLDPSAPNPSVEMLLHAWMPHKFVDHTHATPFLVLANLPEVEAVLRELFGDRIALVPFVKPGFGLAKAAAAAFDANPECEGLLLHNHGHFTWGPDAKASYTRVIEHANMVEAWLQDRRPAPLKPAAALPVAEVAPMLAALRGALATSLPGDAALPVLDLRDDEDTRAFCARPDLEELADLGVATPDHVIRTKAEVLVLRRDAQTPEAMRDAVAAWGARYGAYFEENKARFGGPVEMLTPLPGLCWLEGIGAVGVGMDAKAARIAADIGDQSRRVKADGAAAGGFASITPGDLFDMEYWPLELAKLGTAKPKPLAGRVVLVTGGAGAIGMATAEAFAAEGASIFIVDRPGEVLNQAVAKLGRDAGGYGCDITQQGAAAEAVAACAKRFGGLDILVSNAGAAINGDIATLDGAVLRGSFELNFFSHLAFAQAAIALYRAQVGTRGCRGAEPGQILFNVSKQAVNPGKGFAAYGLPKATLFFLLKQLTLEHGGEGIRVNGINADRIRSGLLTPDMIAARSAARGLDEGSYMAGNLLKAEVEARHVAEAFVMLAKAERTTGHVMTVDGGNIEASLR
ncbi:rhamnose utilization protein RhaD (predicted bifunctional aldolase and dehydrogenase) [Rhodobacter aestuarii]|uniref:Rhamnose utilisation protein RhaD, predicted bifunctional aldolase and dehydrogenase n=1 Tax=Rhodobacter aestuarii TaxID=453582 RepID=A0A1N7PI27_9RHOB|nr:bifunctional aldolase/short-chain dehydrogenase [Rhodobacter aestuarii]PTV94394.1 rhamnose utilization protein RhaD (predicted bifunctional aldolase and dehydrogenase) [Rhodobacter aestuarii]SIT10313.1 Rhamnose utilisation protein RhaD, predicted bifunctional aldolase and dehydrogenase [Rhodobacter aestuarii]